MSRTHLAAGNQGQSMFFRRKKPAGNDNLPVAVPPTVIGAGAMIDGAVASRGDIHVAGTVRGLITADLCVIEAAGSVEGEIEADEIIVAGRVAGPLRARHVHLQRGASVEGDITSETIEVDHGARMSGAVWQREAGQAESEQARPATLPAPDGPRFSSSLWEQMRSDDDRPLKAVRPSR